MHEVSQRVYELLLLYGEIPDESALEFVQRLDADPYTIELVEFVSPEVYAVGVLVRLGAPLTEAGERQKTKHLEAARQRGKPLELPEHLAAHFAKNQME